MLHDDVFDEDLQLPRRLGAVHVDGVLPITDNFPSPVGISRGVPLPPWGTWCLTRVASGFRSSADFFQRGSAAASAEFTRRLASTPSDVGPSFSSSRRWSGRRCRSWRSGRWRRLRCFSGSLNQCSNDCRKHTKGSYDLLRCFFELLETLIMIFGSNSDKLEMKIFFKRFSNGFSKRSKRIIILDDLPHAVQIFTGA